MAKASQSSKNPEQTTPEELEPKANFTTSAIGIVVKDGKRMVVKVPIDADKMVAGELEVVQTTENKADSHTLFKLEVVNAGLFD